MPSQVLLAHPGTQYSYQLARQLARCCLLSEFWTGFALAENSWLAHLSKHCLPPAQQRQIANRIITGVPGAKLRTRPIIEWFALNQLRRGKAPQEVFLRRNQKFQERIPTSSLENASAIIGFDTSSWILAKRVRTLHKPFILDQSISHPVTNESTLALLASHFPDWGTDIEPRLPALLACEKEEYRLASKIVVASAFTKRTMVCNGVDAEKIVINPYGVDLQVFYPSLVPRNEGTVRFLFLGSISARKGVPLLLEAWRSLNLKHAELWLVGHVRENLRRLIPALPNLKILGSYPHQELPDLIRQCDVLVFPSYCEGFGLVLLEALASGLPIITTDATAGPDLIEDGVEGLLIPADSLEALCEAMRRFVYRCEEIEAFSIAARRCAEKFSWDKYGTRWQKIIQKTFNGSGEP